MIQRKRPLTAKIGVFAVAHATYWGQFDGLYDTLMGYHEDFKKLIGNNQVEIIDFGMVDTSEKAYRTAKKIGEEAPELLICNMVTYATSSVFVPIIRNLDIPIVLAALQPLSAMSYDKANTRMQLENDNICAVPEFTNAAIRMGKKVNDVIIGTLYNDPQAEKEIAQWCAIAHVRHSLKDARIGAMGHVLEAMYDMHSDPATLCKAFGVHVVQLEIDELAALYEKVTEKETKAYEERVEALFDMPNPVSDPLTVKLTREDLYESAKTAVALEKFIENNNLTGLAYYYEGEAKSLSRHVASSLIVGNSILIAEGFPMCGEFDLKTCIAMLIMDRMDIGGSFAEFHPFDFNEDFILVGHDGPHHLKIADGKPVLRSLKKYHGKQGHGASVEFKLKEGPITMLGLTMTEDGGFKFVIGEGYSKDGPIPPTGNTNTRGFFEPTTKEFIKKWVMEGPTHHYALGIGHHAKVIAKLADTLGIPWTIVS